MRKIKTLLIILLVIGAITLFEGGAMAAVGKNIAKETYSDLSENIEGNKESIYEAVKSDIKLCLSKIGEKLGIYGETDTPMILDLNGLNLDITNIDLNNLDISSLDLSSFNLTDIDLSQIDFSQIDIAALSKISGYDQEKMNNQFHINNKAKRFNNFPTEEEIERG